MNKNVLKPLLKYPGGKTSELKYIMDYIPKNFDNYIEPFVGGGAVYFFLKNSINYVNDKSKELILLYSYIKNDDIDFYDELNLIISNWKELKNIVYEINLVNLYDEFRKNQDINLISELKFAFSNFSTKKPMFNLSSYKFENFLLKEIFRKFLLIKKNENKEGIIFAHDLVFDNIEAGVKSAYYNFLRQIYNDSNEYNKLSSPRRVAIYLFIREYCYSSMFRFNEKGNFNVPYGGISYNNKSLEKKLLYYKSDELKKLLNNTYFYNEDFYDFVNHIPVNQNDFMFLDPPYDTKFNEYDGNLFTKDDQIRLSNYLEKDCICKFMLIVKRTPLIEQLYFNKYFNIVEIDKKYFVSFKNRNKRETQHLIITNY